MRARKTVAVIAHPFGVLGAYFFGLSLIPVLSSKGGGRPHALCSPTAASVGMRRNLAFIHRFAAVVNNSAAVAAHALAAAPCKCTEPPPTAL
jgi:hypothetical protein